MNTVEVCGAMGPRRDILLREFLATRYGSRGGRCRVVGAICGDFRHEDGGGLKGIV